MTLRVLAAAAAVIVAAAGCSGSDGSTSSVAPPVRAAAAMKVAVDDVHFTVDLLPDGGALTVGISDPFAAQEIGAVGDSLREQQQRLRAGDVSGLRALLGPDTPGLDALAAAPRKLKLGYVELPDGARLEIRSDSRAQAVAVRRLLNQVLVTFGSKASVGQAPPDPTTTTPGPSAPSGFLG